MINGHDEYMPYGGKFVLNCVMIGQPESLCLSEQYLRSLEAPLVQNSTWRGKSNASLYLSSLNEVTNGEIGRKATMFLS